MSLRVLDTLLATLPQLRHEPTRKRIRAVLGGETIVDTTDALLVWEPQRPVPSYAVPIEQLRTELLPAPTAPAATVASLGFRLDAGITVLDPSVPFAVHTTDGEPMNVRTAGQTRDSAAFRLADPKLSSHVILDFEAFDAWYEEDERLVAHPRDPFHRLDILSSSRVVRIELDGTLLAHSTRPRLLFEGDLLPVRCYLPPEDVRVPLQPSPTRTSCAYKGEASYWTPDLPRDDAHDLAWSYEAPLKEAAALAGLVAFFNERVDMTLDGQLQPRPHTPWA